MPTYSRVTGSKYMGGYTKEYNPVDGTWYMNLAHTPYVLGVEQSITTLALKGARAEVIRDLEVGVEYLAPHDVSFNRTKVEATPLRVAYWLYANSRNLYYYEPAGLARLGWFMDLKNQTPPQPTQRQKDLALTMALSRVGTGSFMGAVDLGEVRETIRFMKAPFRSLGEIFAGYTKKVETNFAKVKQQRKFVATRRRISTSRGRRAPASQLPKAERNSWRSELLADTWLEYRYAATPLVLSVCDLAQEAARQIDEIYNCTHTGRGAYRDVGSTEYYKNPETVQDGVVTMRRGTNVTDWSENKISYVILYAYRPWMVDATNLTRFGISPTQIGSTIYELVPLSFVGEWFWNFGTWLKAMEPKPHVKVLNICETHTFKREVYIRDAKYGAYSYYGQLPTVDATACLRREYMKRTVVTNTLQAPVPRLRDVEIGIARSLDALSILGRPISRFFGRYGHLIPRNR